MSVRLVETLTFTAGPRSWNFDVSIILAGRSQRRVRDIKVVINDIALSRASFLLLRKDSSSSAKMDAINSIISRGNHRRDYQARADAVTRGLSRVNIPDLQTKHRANGEREREREREEGIDREGEKGTRERLFVARNNIVLVIRDVKRYPRAVQWKRRSCNRPPASP